MICDARTRGREDANDGRLGRVLPLLRLRIVVRKALVVTCAERGGFADSAVDLGEVENMLLVVLVCIHENRVFRAVFRMELKQLGDGEGGVKLYTLERLAVGALHRLDLGVVETRCVLEDRHR